MNKNIPYGSVTGGVEQGATAVRPVISPASGVKEAVPVAV